MSDDESDDDGVSEDTGGSGVPVTPPAKQGVRPTGYWDGKVEFDHAEAQAKMSDYRKAQVARQQKREAEAMELAAALEQELALE